MHGRRSILWALPLGCLLLVSGPTVGRADAEQTGPSDELREKAVDQLRLALKNESRWVKVHAAEALLALSYPQGVRETFENELKTSGEVPEYRIGIWRVLARASLQKKEKQRWVQKIRDAFLDSDGPDRLHAVETLGKLAYQIKEDEKQHFEKAATSGDTPLAAYTLWTLALEPSVKHQNELARFLASDDSVVRLIAAFTLRYVPELSDTNRTHLTKAAQAEPTDSLARTYLYSTLLAVTDDSAQRALCRKELIRIAQTGTLGERREACHALAERGTTEDLSLLTDLLTDKDADLRIAAAEAILRIGRRVERGISVVDYLVIAGYALGMIAVGWFYSRRTKTTEDYMLGGRTMSPWAVGLSLFATLLSTLTYLAVPGEMIQHGPMFLAQVAAFPFIILIVGWLLIPTIIKYQVTSAYEILEVRLGLSVRLLGSLFFLLLRLLWMAVIIYATTSQVLIPLLGWPPSATPYACAVLGVITVIYTSMGGIQAVVMTDVVQTFILLGGAALTVVLITFQLGGVEAWWPTEWAAHWDPPKLWFDPDARVTIAASFLAAFTWYICTSGSDQMAIQRYLATRDVKSARRMFIISMSVSGVVTVLLAILGFALLAFFQNRPWMLADGQTITTGADQLLPRFLVLGLPVGISGLVVAALLAAAMSSLSSGINSSCSVISVDLMDRFRKDKTSPTDHMRQAKIISWLVGTAVVALSFYAGLVEGNLLVVTFKVVNLMVAPLFVLFFMAMFVPWATTFGTLVAAAASTATAIAIAFYEFLGLKFLWIMPGALVVGVVVGMVMSLLPIGRIRIGRHRKTTETRRSD